jgi:tRNA threonylcarbamoyladenosine biosynthesis protein TsaB
MLVALDTSTNYASIAVVRGEQLAAELTWDVGRRHSQELLGRLTWLLETCGAAPADLTTVAVARGPGSFNGVRVAVTVAKSLAFALGVPLYAFSTLDVIAWGHASAGASGLVVALLEAGRGEVYAARYVANAAPSSPPRAQGGEEGADLRPVGEPEVVTPESLAGAIQGAALVCGEWRPETRSALEAALGERVRFAASLGGRRASWLAALSLAHRAHGQADDPAALEPLYLRRPAITVSARRTTLEEDPTRPGDRYAGAAEEGDARALPG